MARVNSPAPRYDWRGLSRTPLQTAIRKAGGLRRPVKGSSLDASQWRDIMDNLRPSLFRKRSGVAIDEFADSHGFESADDLFLALEREISLGHGGGKAVPSDDAIDRAYQAEVAERERVAKATRKPRKPRGPSFREQVAAGGGIKHTVTAYELPGEPDRWLRSPASKSRRAGVRINPTARQQAAALEKKLVNVRKLEAEAERLGHAKPAGRLRRLAATLEARIAELWADDADEDAAYVRRKNGAGGAVVAAERARERFTGRPVDGYGEMKLSAARRARGWALPRALVVLGAADSTVLEVGEVEAAHEWERGGMLLSDPSGAGLLLVAGATLKGFDEGAVAGAPVGSMKLPAGLVRAGWRFPRDLRAVAKALSITYAVAKKDGVYARYEHEFESDVTVFRDPGVRDLWLFAGPGFHVSPDGVEG